MLESLVALIVAHSAYGAVPARQLAAAIVQETAGTGLNPMLIAQVVLQESRGVPQAYNARTADYGLMQINHRTAAKLNIGYDCLWNWRCNLKHGVAIMATYDRPCRYNVGTGTMVGRRLQNCLRYERKLALID